MGTKRAPVNNKRTSMFLKLLAFKVVRMKGFEPISSVYPIVLWCILVTFFKPINEISTSVSCETGHHYGTKEKNQYRSTGCFYNGGKFKLDA